MDWTSVDNKKRVVAASGAKGKSFAAGGLNIDQIHEFLIHKRVAQYSFKELKGPALRLFLSTHLPRLPAEVVDEKKEKKAEDFKGLGIINLNVNYDRRLMITSIENVYKLDKSGKNKDFSNYGIYDIESIDSNDDVKMCRIINAGKSVV